MKIRELSQVYFENTIKTGHKFTQMYRKTDQKQLFANPVFN